MKKSLPLFVSPPPALSPLFRWVGGKRWLVRLFAERGWIPRPGSRFVEPFAGSCAMALGLAGEGVEVWANDSNRSLVQFFRSLAAGRFPQAPYLVDEAGYAALRDRLNALLACEEVCEEEGHLFFRVLQNSWKGLWRVSQKGRYNVPFGKESQPTRPPMPPFAEVQSRIKGWTFTCGPFTTPLHQATASDFLYLDPPYVGTFSSYTKAPFGLAEHRLLLRLASEHRGSVVISNAPCEELEREGRALGFFVERLDKKSRLVSNSSTKPNEVLYSKHL